MKDLNDLIDKFTNFEKNLHTHLKTAQENTAKGVYEHLQDNANEDTGYFKTTIKIDETKENGNTISTLIASDYMVTSKAGNSYNLGQLLEYGTLPHAIPNAFGFGEHFGIEPDFHPRNESIQQL